MEYIQLEIATYANWIEQEKRWRLTDAELALVKKSYDVSKPGRLLKDLTTEMRYLRDTKARQHRRVKTFDAYLREKERNKARHVPKGSCINKSDDELTKVMRKRLYTIKHKCLEYGLLFDLDLEYLLNLAKTAVCPVYGIKLIYVGKGSNVNLDRHLPNLGYTKGNVNFMSSKANLRKLDSSLEDLRLLVTYMEKKLLSPPYVG